ncbi:hypothetical protein [Mesobacillus jeotgali]|nr:hypothetical protein [Mesobacillus jeotgali]
MIKLAISVGAKTGENLGKLSRFWIYFDSFVGFLMKVVMILALF